MDGKKLLSCTCSEIEALIVNPSNADGVSQKVSFIFLILVQIINLYLIKFFILQYLD